LSRASQFWATYEGVTSCALVWFTFTWTPDVTSIWSVPQHLSVPKMSYVILNDVTPVWVASPFWRDSFWVKIGHSVFLIIYCCFITKNKYLTCSNIYTDFYTCRIEFGEQFLLLTQVQLFTIWKLKLHNYSNILSLKLIYLINKHFSLNK
jgi:hypothetical protein